MNPVSLRKLTAQEWAESMAAPGVPGARPVSVVETARQELAERLGVQANKLRTIDPRWTNLFKSAAKVELEIRRERFEAKLTPADLGVKTSTEAEAKAMNGLIILGKKRLLPEHWPSDPDGKGGPIQDLDEIDDQARYYLTKHSHRTHQGWMVTEGPPYCADHGTLEATTTLADHLEVEHPEQYALYQAIYKARFGDELPSEVDVDAYAAFNTEYPTLVGQGEHGRERGWHFREVMTTLGKFQERYYAVGRRIDVEWDDLQTHVRRDYAIHGYGTYERLRAHASVQGDAALNAFIDEHGDAEEFIGKFVEGVMGSRRAVTREQVAASLSFSIELGHVPLASELEMDRLRAARFQSQRVVAETEARVAEAKSRERIRLETAQDRLATEQLEGERRALQAANYERERQAVQLERDMAAQRRAQATEMERAIASQAQKRLEEEVFTFVADVRQTVRSKVYDTVVDALAALRANDAGKFPAGSVKSLRELVDVVAALDLYGEPDLQAKIKEVRGLLQGNAKDRPTNLIAARLQDLGAESRFILMELDRPPVRSAAELGIPDDVEGLVTQLTRRPEAQLQLGGETVELEQEAPRRAEPALAL